MKYKYLKTGEIFIKQEYPFIKDDIYFNGNYYKKRLFTVRQSYINKHPELFIKL